MPTKKVAKKSAKKFDVTEEQALKIGKILGCETFVIGAFDPNDREHQVTIARKISMRELFDYTETVQQDCIKQEPILLFEKLEETLSNVTNIIERKKQERADVGSVKPAPKKQPKRLFKNEKLAGKAKKVAKKVTAKKGKK